MSARRSDGWTDGWVDGWMMWTGMGSCSKDPLISQDDPSVPTSPNPGLTRGAEGQTAQAAPLCLSVPPIPTLALVGVSPPQLSLAAPPAGEIPQARPELAALLRGQFPAPWGPGQGTALWQRPRAGCRGVAVSVKGPEGGAPRPVRPACGSFTRCGLRQVPQPLRASASPRGKWGGQEVPRWGLR